MAAVPVTIVGIETRSDGTSENVTIVGMASMTGLGVGGGPIMPPPEIWPSPGRPTHPIAPGGPPPHVEHPIVLPPVEPGGPPIDVGAHPEHPIVLPPPPSGGVKPPPPGGGWGYHPEYGWGYFPKPTEPGPKHVV